MTHYYSAESMWRYRSALDPKCCYDTGDEARAADRETAIYLIAEQTPATLSAALWVRNEPLRMALEFLAAEMDGAVAAPAEEPRP